MKSLTGISSEFKVFFCSQMNKAEINLIRFLSIISSCSHLSIRIQLHTSSWLKECSFRELDKMRIISPCRIEVPSRRLAERDALRHCQLLERECDEQTIIIIPFLVDLLAERNVDAAGDLADLLILCKTTLDAVYSFVLVCSEKWWVSGEKKATKLKQSKRALMPGSSATEMIEILLLETNLSVIGQFLLIFLERRLS
jgi:hypothetical protein